MAVHVERATLPCNVCGAAVVELRRGRCWGCYTRWADARPVGRGATCTLCQEKRRSELRLVEIHRRSLPFCHGCAAAVMRLPEVPETIEGLRTALRRDRRDGDRRNGKVDQRIFPRERRVGERRSSERGEAFADTHPGIRLEDLREVEDVIIELQDEELEGSDQTMVRASPAPAPAAANDADDEKERDQSADPPATDESSPEG